MTKRTCSFEGCTKPLRAHGLCNGHNEQRRAGKPLTPLRSHVRQDPELTAAGFRRCRDCEQVKPLDAFHWCPPERGTRTQCKECAAVYRTAHKRAKPELNRAARRRYAARYPDEVKVQKRESNARNFDGRRARRIRELYGITVDQFEALLADQGGRCAICRSDAPGGKHGVWQVDHDHVTSRVRGILCDGCNRGLGFLRESAANLRAAVAYLERTQ